MVVREVWTSRSASSRTSATMPALRLAKHPLAWLDLRGLGLSALERLSLEELLLRHDPSNRCWGIVGCHEPAKNRLLTAGGGAGRNTSCAIVLGIGGKLDRLVNVPAAKRDGVLVLRRFSGGGTVVVDHDSLWTTFIGRNDAPLSASGERVEPFPREIMAWSADTIFRHAFHRWNKKSLDGARRRGTKTLVVRGKSCGVSGSLSESLILPPDGSPTLDDVAIPTFQLKENDYVLGERKMGGNAQSIVSSGFLHHTSFLWDYDPSNMDYLTLPEKRPDYRRDRSHDDFLLKLKETFGHHSNKSEFFDHVKAAAGQTFDLEDRTFNEVLDIANDKFGSLQQWFDGKCRTKIVPLQ